jgi:hypothetical protein
MIDTWRRRRTAVLGVMLGVVVLLGIWHPIPSAWAQGQLFVSDYGTDTITVYPWEGDGNIPPSAIITTGDGPHQLAINYGARELIVTNNTSHSITVVDRDTLALKRTIQGPSTGLHNPTGVVVDEMHQLLYVANDDHSASAFSITVYDLTASGDAAPLRTIQGANTGLGGPVGVALDLVAGELVVVNYKVNAGGSITVYNLLALSDGVNNVAPTQTIQGTNTGLQQPQGVILDLKHDEIVVANSFFQNPISNGAILVFQRAANGNVAPVRTLQGTNTRLCSPIDLALNLARHELVVANSQFGQSCDQSVTTYAWTPGVSGSFNTAPLRTIAGAASGLANPTGVAFTTGADITIEKTTTTPSVTAGASVSYDLKATVTGGPVLDVLLIDTLPAGLVWSVSGPDATACDLSAGNSPTLICDFGDMPQGTSRQIHLVATTKTSTCPASLMNQATLTFNDGSIDVTKLSPSVPITINCPSFRDTVPPSITVLALPVPLWPTHDKMVPVIIAGTMKDAGSGVNESTATYTVTDEYGRVQPSGHINLSSSGIYAFLIQLQASRNAGDRNGRQYTITVSAQDKAGNKGAASTHVTLPYNSW